MIEAHLPLGLISKKECDKYSKVPVIRHIAGSKKEAEVRRLRFYAGDVCERNHRIRDLITHRKIPYSVRYKRDDKCAWCCMFARLNTRKTKKKTRRIKEKYSFYKNKEHRHGDRTKIRE